MKNVLKLYLVLLAVMSMASFGATIAHWDFADPGAVDQANMPGNASREADLSGNGTIGPEDFVISSADLSGNGNHLSAWSSSWMKWTATSFQGDFAMEATNNYPDARTDSHWSQPTGVDIEMITPREWTVECVFQATAGTNRTMVGRIGYQLPGASNQSVAAFYLAERSNQRINCEYVDVTGAYHNATSANGALVAGTWYHVAAVSDGTTLSLYLKNLDADTDYQVVATADLSGSTDPSIIRDEYVAGSFATNGGSWTVACGTYNNATGDRFVSPGKIDMAAISDAALAPGSFVAQGGKITAPYPGSGQSQVELAPTLQWNGLADAVDETLLDSNVLKHYVYIDYDNKDEDPNLYYQGEVVVSDWSSRAAAYGPLALTYDQSVSWQVEEGLDNGTGEAYAPGDPNNVLGSIWRFITLKSIPVVPTNQPLSVRAFPTEAAVFTVNFTSVSAPTVKWFKDDNTSVTEITAGTDTVDNNDGSYTTTLTLDAPLAVSDEGQYYCSVSNNGEWFDSGVANLVVKRQLAQYTFDGALTDSSTNGAPTGTALDTQGDPNSLNAVSAAVSYVDGADGVTDSALYLDANEYVDFSTEGYPKASAVTTNGSGGGLDEGTIVFWVKPNVANQQQTFVGAFNDGGTNAFLTLLQADQDLDLYIRGANGTALANHPAGRPNRPEFNLTDGGWHMMAACWSGNTSTLYVDGQWVVNNTGSTPASFDAWQYGVLLGATRTSANRNILSDMFSGGAIDNLRIYNYRLDAGGNVEAFAQEYMDLTGIQPCINMSFEGNAFNYDNTGSSYCKVDLADLTVIVSQWLDCGMYSCN